MSNMNFNEWADIFQCPICKGKLLWEQKKCARCEALFRIDGDILDFIHHDNLAKQQRDEIERHKLLAPKYQKRYEPEFSKLFSRYWNKQFISHLPENPLMILDNGCGTGDLLGDMLPYCKRMVGSDISRGMINQARQLIGDREDIIWVVSPSESLPFSDGIFDVICFRGALHHMADEISALKEAYRMLKDGGLVMISEPNDDSILLRGPRKVANRYMARFDGDHKAFKSKRWLKTIESIGFTIKHTKHFSFLSQPVCGMSDVVAVMKILPFSNSLAKWLICFDEICSELPGIRKQSFDFFVVAQK